MSFARIRIRDSYKDERWIDLNLAQVYWNTPKQDGDDLPSDVRCRILLNNGWTLHAIELPLELSSWGRV